MLPKFIDEPSNFHLDSRPQYLDEASLNNSAEQPVDTVYSEDAQQDNAMQDERVLSNPILEHDHE